MASKREREEREHNEQSFNQLFRNGEETPESIVTKVMWGQEYIQHRGKERRITKTMTNAAFALLPYRLPRLNSIDAQVKHVEMTHEDWLKTIEGGTDGDK